jgi:hypothetical protein
MALRNFFAMTSLIFCREYANIPKLIWPPRREQSFEKETRKAGKTTSTLEITAEDDLIPAYILTTIEQQHNIFKNNGHLTIIARDFTAKK